MKVELKIEDKKSVTSKFEEDFDKSAENINFQGGFCQKREIMKLPPSAKFILYLLKLKGPMNRKGIIEETMMPDRTVGFALKKLLEKNLIQKIDSDISLNNTPGRKRKHQRQDGRITNYDLVSTALSYEMART